MSDTFNSFDESEFDDNGYSEPTQDEALDSIVNEFSDEEVDAEMSEAERRFSLAAYYKQLTRGGIFGDGTHEGDLVDQEIRNFARERMADLLGFSKKKAEVVQEAQFSKEEVDILKALIAKLTKTQAEPATPVIKKQEAPAAPVMTRRQAPAAPQVKKRAVAQPARAPEPQHRPQAQAAKSAVKKPVAQAPKPKAKGNRDISEIPTGEVFREGGKTFKMVESGEDEHGNVIRFKQNITAAVIPPNRVPMPSTASLPMVTMERAAADVANSMSGSNKSLQNAVTVTAQG